MKDVPSRAPAVSVQVRRAGERGHADQGWSRSHHTFSFADYCDRRFMGFRALRVLNEEELAPGARLGRHPHRDMEILSYVVSGSLGSEDERGCCSVAHRGELRRLSAGTGVRHEEFNASAEVPVRYVELWVMPDKIGYGPTCEQRAFESCGEGWQLLASPRGSEGSVSLHQDARLYRGCPLGGVTLPVRVTTSRHAWLHVIRGKLVLGVEELTAGDGAAIEGAASLELRASEASEVLLLELA